MAVINKFGAESQTAGNSISIALTGSTNLDVYPVQVTSPYQLTAGGPTNIRITSCSASDVIKLPLASAAIEGLTYTIRTLDADDLLIKDSTASTTYATLTNAGEWVSFVCQNQTPLGTGVAAFAWVITGSSPIIATN